MITVQINTPNSNKLKSNILLNGTTGTRPGIKPSKSSVDLSAQDYEKYFTLKGKNGNSFFSKYFPPVDFTIVAVCFAWYTFSAISSNITKDILRQFPHPITLTEIQFLISSALCFITIIIVNNNRWLIEKFPVGTLPSVSKFKESRTSLTLIRPNDKIVKTTLPMGIFQFVGHITSHKATSVIPVSIVHSVKALSPLSTVLAYTVFFKVRYPTVTYLTLIPLMLGVIITCFSKNQKNSNNEHFEKGLIFAFISMMIFVSQNIFAKKILTVKPKSLPTNLSDIKEQEKEEEKIDKITILLYCSLIGFILTFPLYLVNEFTSESLTILQLNFSVISLFLLQGFSHFFQAMIAFHLIGSISPVNYSIANILKRIVVISMSIVWERENVNKNQGFGLLLTMVGLYLYDRFGMTKN